MIFVTKDRSERPLAYAYVNGVTVRALPNGGEITTYTLGTSEKKKDGTKVFSSWFANVMGEARRQCEARPLEKGDNIAIYGYKMTNVSKKNDDGTFGKAFFNMTISDYILQEKNGSSSSNDEAPEDNYAY